MALDSVRLIVAVLLGILTVSRLLTVTFAPGGRRSPEQQDLELTE